MTTQRAFGVFGAKRRWSRWHRSGTPASGPQCCFPGNTRAKKRERGDAGALPNLVNQNIRGTHYIRQGPQRGSKRDMQVLRRRSFQKLDTEGPVGEVKDLTKVRMMSCAISLCKVSKKDLCTRSLGRISTHGWQILRKVFSEGLKAEPACKISWRLGRISADCPPQDLIARALHMVHAMLCAICLAGRSCATALGKEEGFLQNLF